MIKKTFYPNPQLTERKSKMSPVLSFEHAQFARDALALPSVIAEIVIDYIGFFNGKCTHQQALVNKLAQWPNGKLATATSQGEISILGSQTKFTCGGHVLFMVALACDRLAIATIGRNIEVWNALTGMRDFVQNMNFYALAMCALPNDSVAIAYSALVNVYSVSLHKLHFVSQLRKHERIVSSVVHMPEKKLLVSASADQICVWTLANHGLVFSIEGNWGSSHCLLALPHSKFVAGSWDAQCRVWDVDTRECTVSEASHVLSLAYLDGAFVTGDRNGRLRVWSVDTGTEIMELPVEPSEKLLSMVGLADGGLATASYEGTLTVWR